MPRHLLLNTSRFLVDEATAGDRLIISGVLTTEVSAKTPNVAAERYGRLVAHCVERSRKLRLCSFPAAGFVVAHSLLLAPGRVRVVCRPKRAPASVHPRVGNQENQLLTSPFHFDFPRAALSLPEAQSGTEYHR